MYIKNTLYIAHIQMLHGGNELSENEIKMNEIMNKAVQLPKSPI